MKIVDLSNFKYLTVYHGNTYLLHFIYDKISKNLIKR